MDATFLREMSTLCRPPADFAERPEGQPWETNGRWYVRKGGKTKRIADPNAADGTKSLPADPGKKSPLPDTSESPTGDFKVTGPLPELPPGWEDRAELPGVHNAPKSEWTLGQRIRARVRKLALEWVPKVKSIPAMLPGLAATAGLGVAGTAVGTLPGVMLGSVAAGGMLNKAMDRGAKRAKAARLAMARTPAERRWAARRNKQAYFAEARSLLDDMGAAFGELSHALRVHRFAWKDGKRGGRYWLPAGKQDVPANRLYGAKAEAAANASKGRGGEKTPRGGPKPGEEAAVARAKFEVARDAHAAAVAAKLPRGRIDWLRERMEAARKELGAKQGGPAGVKPAGASRSGAGSRPAPAVNPPAATERPAEPPSTTPGKESLRPTGEKPAVATRNPVGPPRPRGTTGAGAPEPQPRGGGGMGKKKADVADVVRYAKELRDGTHSIATVRGLAEHLAGLSDAEVRSVSRELGYTPLDRTKKGVIANLVRNLEGIQMSRQRTHQIATGESHRPDDPPPAPPKPAGTAVPAAPEMPAWLAAYPGGAAVYDLYAKSSGRVRTVMENALHNAGVINGDGDRVRAEPDDPGGTAGYSFPEVLGGQLARAYRDQHDAGHTAAEIAPVETALRKLGAEPVGEPGAVVPFDGSLHDHVRGLFTGDPVRVVRPGWALDRGDGSRFVPLKARIEKAPPAATPLRGKRATARAPDSEGFRPGGWLQRQYQRFEKRYGKWGARAVVAGMALPVPGTAVAAPLAGEAVYQTRRILGLSETA